VQGNGYSIGKRRNAGMARVQRFPSGKLPGGHLSALHSLAREQPLLRDRALHMTTGRLAVARLVCKGQAQAAESVHNLRWFEVTDTRGHIENGKVAHWQVTLKVGFTLDE